MGQHASIYDLRDPKTKLAHLVNSDHGNVYSIKFEINSFNQQQIQRPTTLTQDVRIYLSFLFLNFVFVLDNERFKYICSTNNTFSSHVIVINCNNTNLD